MLGTEASICGESGVQEWGVYMCGVVCVSVVWGCGVCVCVSGVIWICLGCVCSMVCVCL